MTRILTALVLVPIAVWATLWGPSWAFLAITALVGVAAHREFDSITAAHGVPASGWLAAALGVAWLLTPERMVLAALVLAALILMTASLRLTDFAGALTAAATGVLGIVYIFGAWRCAVALRAITPHWVMIALLVSWAGDTAAFYIGRAFGRHKLAPLVSPSKTWEGAMASVAGGTIAAGVYAHFLIPPANLAAVLAIGAFANIAGQVGDLAESAFKRGAGVKDSGSSLPGHGGWLDRIDSSLFSIPAVYAVFRIAFDLQ